MRVKLLSKLLEKSKKKPFVSSFLEVPCETTGENFSVVIYLQCEIKINKSKTFPYKINSVTKCLGISLFFIKNIFYVSLVFFFYWT